ncbi:MAG TPA: D-aminoacyl-tRNA deacylase, partial [Bacteroidia bacterium]|nr:D-aminoacyl-tRNA deacylase [Bacteroidia bacterium]
RVVIQRVSEASVKVEGKIISSIQLGLLILLGVEDADTDADVEWLSSKISRLRIFADENNQMNLSVADVAGEILVVSQFTLHASTKKGNRPSFINAARPEKAIPLYESFLIQLGKDSGLRVLAGEFGADMKVALVNDGPVTILMDSQMKE